MIVGFDFGTTNSLVSAVIGNRVIDVHDDEGRPHPSVVRYEGEAVIVGREAREALEEVGIGVHGNTVRSPKFLLGDEIVPVGGVDRSPIDVVADVIRYVREQSLAHPQGKNLGGLDRAVVTIPVNMNGLRRAALREAFAQVGISIVQFVHEPFAALYGYLRGSKDPEGALRELARRNVLVIDWGGGTLDLTLCRIEQGRILQIRNLGSHTVGGDQFDKVIADEVVKRFVLQHGVAAEDAPTPEARLRLRQVAEENKIALSTRANVTFYRPGYFPESGKTLEYTLSRQELEEMTRPLVAQGIKEVEALLDAVGLAPSQVSRCIVAGGMAAMPSIRSRLHELFGPQRVDIPDNSATLVSQGAAWIAHDQQRLVLSKPIEIELARGARLPVLHMGRPMPADGDHQHEEVHLYCTDPSDGKAKIALVTPERVSATPQAGDPRETIGMLTLEVDPTAPPLHERIKLDLEINDDLILTLTALSSQREDRQSATYFELEFGIGFPGASEIKPSPRTVSAARATGGLVVRANISDKKDRSLVPGDVLHKYTPAAFSRLPGDRATEEQVREHLYYQPCAVCKRPWGHPACRCASSRG